MKGDVCYFDEIIKELSEEHGIGEKEMREICGNSIDYIKTLIKEKDTLTIPLPKLGYLYFNSSIGRFVLTQQKFAKERGYELRDEEIEFLEGKLSAIDEQSQRRGKKKTKHNQRPFLYKFKNILKKMKLYKPRQGATFATHEVWGKVSELQNDINAE